MLEELIKIVGEENVIAKERMSKHTSFRIGGVAKYFVTVPGEAELIRLLSYLESRGQRYYILGNGSNVLFGDEGFDGVIVHLGGAFKEIAVSPAKTTITAGAACILAQLSRTALEHSLTGLEFAFGIPGSLGGAIVMNAGAYGGEMKQVVTKVRILQKCASHHGKEIENIEDVKRIASNAVSETDSHFEIHEYDNEQMHFAYRHSLLKEQEGVVLSVTVELSEGNAEEIQAKMEDYTNQRRTKQPLEYPSAGSTFKRPEGYFAGKLISDAGLKGYQVGGAQVSEKHAGFVINKGDATAADVRRLMKDVSDIVQEKFGVTLEPEVIYVE